MNVFSGSVIGIFLLSALVAVGMWGCPTYAVWQQGQAGKAELAHAHFSRQAAIQTAHATMESAKLLADAEIERARGVAEANRIIADGLKGHNEYLTYLWIDKVAGTAQREIVYVATEAGIPVLEAGRAVRSNNTPSLLEQRP